MSKIDKVLKAKFDALTQDQLDRKVVELKHTIPELNAQLDYAVAVQRARRHAAARKAVDDSTSRRSSI